MSIEVDWAWGRDNAPFSIESAKLRPNEWVTCGSTPDKPDWDLIWDTSMYPLRYYLNLEDYVETKVEVVGDRKYLYAKYSPPVRRSRFKEFIARARQSRK